MSEQLTVDVDSKTLVAEVRECLREKSGFVISASKRANNRARLVRALRALQRGDRLRFIDILLLSQQLASMGLIEELEDRDWSVVETQTEVSILVSAKNAKNG
ncbi:MAG: hypothetical protein C0511_19450 [Hyphomicrobium sp.]|nr:hypothetical protein [Hyphomicrobium sp.]